MTIKDRIKIIDGFFDFFKDYNKNVIEHFIYYCVTLIDNKPYWLKKEINIVKELVPTIISATDKYKLNIENRKLLNTLVMNIACE